MVISLLKYRMYIVYTYKYVVLAHPNDGMIAVMQEEEQQGYVISVL
jgi:hypothetical protein